VNRRFIGFAFAACGAIAFSSAAISADLPPQARAEVSLPVKFDTSPVPLREMYDRAPPRVARGGRDFEPGKPLPIGNTNVPMVDPLAADGVGASAAGISPLAGTTGTGVDPAARVAPPDTTGDIGPNHYVQWVNLRFAIYNVARDANKQITAFNVVPGFPKNGNTIWNGFGGPCETSNDGDPLVQYDQLADRWVLTQFAVSAAPYTQCVAVSQTGDPTGTYNRYSYSYGTDFNDYPHMGVWPDGYYITYNMFKRGRTFAGNKVCAFERDKMLIGAAARQICAQTTNSYASLLPSDLEGTVLPPAGSANPLLSISSTSLLAWRFAVNWSAGTGTLTGPTAVTGVATFARACSGGTCIPQKGSTTKLDSLADRLMYRLGYRNNGVTESLVVNHSVTSGTSTGIRWYELRNAPGQKLGSSVPTVYQQGTYAPTSDYRWMGSAAMDKSGGIVIGYNVSSATISPGIRYAGRAATDTLGSLGTEQAILTGPGSQTGTLTRWGDYSTIAVDPSDGCQMVFTTEFIPSNGSFNWSTYIHSMKLSTCQ
jgi:hypothetical protein